MQTWTQQEDCLRSVVLFSSWQSAEIVGLWYCDNKTVIFFFKTVILQKMKLNDEKRRGQHLEELIEGETVVGGVGTHRLN